MRSFLLAALATLLLSARIVSAQQGTPDSVLATINVPVLTVFGGMDRNLPVDASVAQMRAAFVRGGNRDATIVVFPRAGHGITLVQDDRADRLPAHGRQEPAPGYVELVLQWLRRQAQRAPGP